MIMELVYSFCLVILALIGIMARKESLTEKKPFKKSAAFLFRKLFHHTCSPLMPGMKISEKYQGFIREDVNIVKDMRTVYPGRNVEKEVRTYYIDKIQKILLLFFAGNILSLTVCLAQRQNVKLSDEGVVWKNSWEQGSLGLELWAEITGKDSMGLDGSQSGTVALEDIAAMIEPKSLTEAETAILAEKAFLELARIISGENESMKRITTDLKLVSRLETYPFRIDWESDRLSILQNSGQVDNEAVSREGEAVTLTAWLNYQDPYQEYRYRRDFNLQVFPPVQSPEERWQSELNRAIEISKEENAYREMVQLPRTVRGFPVKWHEKPRQDSLYFWIFVWIASATIYFGQDRDFHKKIIKRNKELGRDYPELISKLVLYLGAGMTVKNAWKKMVQEYIHRDNGGDRRALYEEMMVSLRELENGVSEYEVYFRFGKRTGGAGYRKLAGLLCNYVQKGNKNLLRMLREEADLALEERKNKARVIGEEMGTKLLFPMMLMLLIVMIIIMIPAYAVF